MAQEVQVYDNAVVLESKLSQKYLTSLADVAIRDYKKDFGFSKDVFALDMDSVETDRSGSNDKTMDAAIGVAQFSANRVTSARLLLIELRLNYTGQGQNSKTSDMKSKEEHTRALLNNHTLDKRSFFIFNKNVAPHKRSTINRESQVEARLKNWLILSPEEFVNQFMFVENLPYQPESPIDNIKKDGSDFVAVANFDKALNLVNYWLHKVQDFYNKYNLKECSVLLPVVKEVLDAVDSRKDYLTEDNLLDVQIAKEDIAKYTKLLSDKESSPV